MRFRTAAGLALALAVFAAPVPGFAQLEGQLSAYTGPNAKGYLKPFQEAFGATLNSGFFYSANIRESFRLSLEFPIAGVIFDDSDRTFNATTEDPFIPETTVNNAPTIVGDGGAVTVPGQGSTQFSFPGGFNLNSFGLIVPQLRLGFKGTEALVRLVAGVDTGDAELGKIDLYGFAVRHSISRYLDEPPVDVAVTGTYQTFSMGENSAGNDLLNTDAWSIGAQASKALPVAFMRLEPYTGLSLDSFRLSAEYETNASTNETLKVEYDWDNSFHWTIGIGLNLVAAQAWAQYDIASRDSFGFGLALGNVGY